MADEIDDDPHVVVTFDASPSPTPWPYQYRVVYTGLTYEMSRRRIDAEENSFDKYWSELLIFPEHGKADIDWRGAFNLLARWVDRQKGKP